MSDNNSKNIIDLLKQGDKLTLEKIYTENRDAFINFSKKYNIAKYDAVDIYQDAILVLRENAIDGKIDSLNSNISTYLFAIGKYKIFHSYRLKSKIELSNDILIDEKKLDFDVNLLDEELTNQQKLLKENFDKLGDRCKNVLKLFYYQGFTLDEITTVLNYSSKKVLKSQKSRCVKQLKDLINKHI
jgi:RNA polymerase sigma factor (sigma-70 family)